MKNKRTRKNIQLRNFKCIRSTEKELTNSEEKLRIEKEQLSKEEISSVKLTELDWFKESSFRKIK